MQPYFFQEKVCFYRIGHKMATNVLRLQEVAMNQAQALTNITKTLN